MWVHSFASGGSVEGAGGIVFLVVVKGIVQRIVEVELAVEILDNRSVPCVAWVAGVVQVFPGSRCHSVLYHPAPWARPAPPRGHALRYMIV